MALMESKFKHYGEVQYILKIAKYNYYRGVATLFAAGVVRHYV